MALPEDSADFNNRVEALTQALERCADVDARRSARELAGLILAFHASGLTRILDIIGPDEQLNQRLTSDPVIAALLDLHDLRAPSQGDRPPHKATGSNGPLIQILRHAGPRSAAAAPLHNEEVPTCERCGEPVPESHNHHVDVATRRLSCSCRACWLLSGATGPASVRAVPERYVQGPALQFQSAQWEALQIPVSIAFFMINSSIGRTVAFYPSPAGATESALPLTTWHDVERTNPWVRSLVPDVEALLVRKGRDADDDGVAFIVPIDACYDLVGRIRRRWNGFSGGAEVQSEMDRFFMDIAARSHRAAVAVAGGS
jgi:hypothetical protein